MGVGLQPLEFSECLTDSPQFRENLHNHEKELERTSQQIKRLIKEVKDTVHAAKRLRAAQLALATSMEQLEFACIGASMTDDELAISHSLSHLATLIRTVEDERERMLGRAHEQIIEPLERLPSRHLCRIFKTPLIIYVAFFKFKKTAKFCQTQERTLGLSTKKPDNVFQEADAGMEMAERDFCAASLEYVFLLQAVQERKKFELVETLLGFVFGWWTFHHQAHEVHNDAEPLVRDLQLRIQRTRTNFEETSKQTESLMKKMMEMRQTCAEEGPGGGAANNAASGLTRAGYLFLMERKAFGTAWTKHYCTYERTSSLLTLTPYNQINVKTTGPTDSVCVCGARRAADAVERRFCWEALPVGGERPPLTLQALSDRDRTRWLRALRSAEREERDAVPPAYALDPGGGAGESGCALDEAGFTFVRRIISVLEARGLDEQGLYRVAGVASKVSRLVACAADPRRLPASLNDPLEWETKTLTSALKSFLRALPEPLCTRRLHARWVSAAKREARTDRLGAMHALLHALPAPHRDMLSLVVRHLREVAARAPHNLMSASNLAVCFGPTLLRPERETVASIMELKFCNVVVETLIDNYDLLFLTPPIADGAGPAPLSTPASIPPNGHLRWSDEWISEWVNCLMAE
ncbi:Rho GTPase-activating protein 26 [Eumeta japonica]|uniref:Rho GTPase-activating protein 26 n=1 Tax=Eumeta variegata TaxID=151549 RepID=A0A4C1ZDK0_EUMVA|nr:Rho GTPase-activating protein 26 [Eumeta japonica]